LDAISGKIASNKVLLNAISRKITVQSLRLDAISRKIGAQSRNLIICREKALPFLYKLPFLYCTAFSLLPFFFMTHILNFLGGQVSPPDKKMPFRSAFHLN